MSSAMVDTQEVTGKEGVSLPYQAAGLRRPVGFSQGWEFQVFPNVSQDACGSPVQSFSGSYGIVFSDFPESVNA